MESKDNLKECMFKEMDIIESIIKRMAFNSFLIKGWSITLITVTLLLKGSFYQGLVALVPLFTFWYLDAVFLWQERAYRKLYGWVVNNRLDTDEKLFDMNASSRFGDNIGSVVGVMISKTLIVFYGTIFSLIVIYAIFFKVFAP